MKEEEKRKKEKKERENMIIVNVHVDTKWEMKKLNKCCNNTKSNAKL